MHNRTHITRNASLTFTIALTSVLMATTASLAHAQSSEEPGVCAFQAIMTFTESAPRDRFSIINVSRQSWNIDSLSLDLTPSAGNLMFDVTASGAGVEVFQPFRGESESAILSKEPTVEDGDQSITLAFGSFAPQEEYQFSIDLDDQLADSELGQIRVSDNEMRGAVLTIAITDSEKNTRIVSGVFGDTNALKITYGEC